MATLSFHILVVAITGVLVVQDYDIFPFFFEDLPFRITNEPWDARFLAWSEKDNYPNQYKRTGKLSGYRTTREWYSSVDVIYDAGESNKVFTKEILQKMKIIEEDVLTAPGYEKWCQIIPQTGNCSKPLSVLRFFDGSMTLINSIFEDPDFDSIPAVLYEAFTNNKTREQFRFFLCQGGTVTQTGIDCSVTRSMIPLGTPHQDYPDTEDYRQAVNTYSGDNIKPILEKYLGDNDGLFKLFFRSSALWIHDVTAQAQADSLWVGGSIGFIFILILVLTRSFWIACLAIFSIFTSFITGNLIYNLVYGYTYLGFFHILALFIILGIGADDIFVFYNIWRNSGTETYPSLAHRLTDVYKRSAISMLFTSITTAVAFLSSAITPLLATRSFGLFAATVVVVNYISVIVYFPTVVIMYHTYFESSSWPCCIPCNLLGRKCSKKKNKSNGNGDRHDDGYERTNNPETNDRHSNPAFDNSTEASVDWKEALTGASRIEIKRPCVNGKVPAPSAEGGYKLYSITKGKPSSSQSNRSRNSMYDSLEKNFHPMDNGVTRNGGQHGDPRRESSTQDNRSGSKSRSLPRYDAQTGQPYVQRKQNVHKKKTPIAVRFFTNYYFRFVTNPVTRWILLSLIAGLLGFFIYQASMINADSDKAVSEINRR